MTFNRILLTLTIIAIGALSFLSFAPVQTGKWVYMWQAFVWPAFDDGGIEYMDEEDGGLPIGPTLPPKNYSGNWNAWGRNGKQYIQLTYKNGVPHGHYSYRDIDHKFGESGLFHLGKKVGWWKFFAPGSGDLIREYEHVYVSTYREHYYKTIKNLVGGKWVFITCDHNDVTINDEMTRYYEDGKKITVYSKSKGIDRRTDFGIPIE